MVKQRITLYTLSVLIPYFIVKKFFPEKSKVITKETDLRGGDNTLVPHVISLLVKDRAIKIAIASLFSTAMLNEFNEGILLGLIQSSPSILAAPHDKKRFFYLSKKVRRILGTPDIIELRELLLDKHLSNHDKIALLKIKIESILKHLHGRKRIYFITTLLSLLIFLLGNNTPIFTLFWASLPELFNTSEMREDIDEYLIELYQEFNAPLPQDLISKVVN